MCTGLDAAHYLFLVGVVVSLAAIAWGVCVTADEVSEINKRMSVLLHLLSNQDVKYDVLNIHFKMMELLELLKKERHDP